MAVGFSTTPSPQISLQTLAEDELPDVHVYPASTVQLLSQPSPLILLPSSQYPTATFITNPSPHISEHVLAVTLSPNVHVYPVSTEQVELHPSPFKILLSSQYPDVGFKIIPSPQVSAQLLAVEESPSVQV